MTTLPHQQAISSNRKTLCHIIDIDTTLLDALVANKVISQNQLEKIKTEKSSFARISELLTVIYKGDRDTFCKFVDVLRENDNGAPADVLTNQNIQIPHIVLVADTGNRDPWGTRDLLENLRDNLLHVDERCQVDVIDEDTHSTVKTENISLILGTIPGSARIVKDISNRSGKNVPVAFLVTKSTDACHKCDDYKSVVELISSYRKNYMSLPNDIFFLGTHVKHDWKQHFEHCTNCRLYIPAPVAMDEDVLARFTKPTKNTKILVDLTCLETDDVDKEFVSAFQNLSCLLSVELFVLVTSKDVLTTDLHVPESAKVIAEWTRQDIITGFRNDTIWVFPKEKCALTWTRMFPLLYGVPQVMHIDSLTQNLVDMTHGVQEDFTWTGTDNLLQAVQNIIEHPIEANARAHGLTDMFLRSKSVNESRANMFIVCFKNNVVRLKFKIIKRIDELKDAVPREEASLTQRLLSIFWGQSKSVTSTNVVILEEIEKRLPNNVKVLKMGYGSICFHLYVPDDDACNDLYEAVYSGETSDGMLFVLLLVYEHVFPNENINELGVEVELYLPDCQDIHVAILRDSAMMQEKGAWLLYQAVSIESVRLVELLLQNGANPNKETRDGISPLMFAAYRGHLDTVRLLIDHAAEVNSKDQYKNTPLILASKKGHLDVVSVLLDKGADVNQTNKYEETALILASINGHLDVVSVLLDKGAAVNQTNKDRNSPLILASKKGHLDVVSVLLDKGAAVNQTNKYENTPLILASLNGHLDVVSALLDKGAVVNQTNQDENTPLILASNKGHLDIVSLLLDIGAAVNQTNKDEDTPLIMASQEGHHDVVSLLLDKGAAVNQTNKDADTPLIMATQEGHHYVVSLLLDKGAAVNQTNKIGDSPLLWAAYRGDLDTSRLLIDHAGEVDSKDKIGEFPLLWAAYRGDLNIARLLIDHAAEVDNKDQDDNTPLIMASQKGHHDIVSLLLDQGGAVNQTNKEEETPLIMASRVGHHDVVSLLLDKAAAVNQTNKDWKSSEQDIFVSPVHFLSNAAWESADPNPSHDSANAAVRLLVEKDEDTPLILASMEGHLDVVSLLLGKGAAVNQTGKDGRSPLISATLGGHLDVVRQLLDHGADIDSRDKNSGTALSAATMIDVMLILLEHGAFLDPVEEPGMKTPLSKCLAASPEDLPSSLPYILIQHGADVNNGIPESGCIIKFVKDRPDIEVLKWVLFESGYSSRNDTFVQDTLNLHLNFQSELSSETSFSNKMSLQQAFVQINALVDEILMSLKHARSFQNPPSEDIKAPNKKGVKLPPEIFQNIEDLERMLKYPAVASMINPKLTTTIEKTLSLTELSKQLNQIESIKLQTMAKMHQVKRLTKVCHWFDKHAHQVRELTHLCRIAVRAAIKELTGGRSIVAPVERLTLPTKIKNELIFKHVIPTPLF